MTSSARQNNQRDPNMAVILSVIPGLGQLYNGETRKGLLFLGVTAINFHRLSADGFYGAVPTGSGFIQPILSYEAEPRAGGITFAGTFWVSSFHGDHGTVPCILCIYSKRCLRQSSSHSTQTDISGICHRTAGSDERIVTYSISLA